MALLSIAAICKRTGRALDSYNEAMELVRQHARVVAHFHPDRFGGKPTNVVDSLLVEGVYRNQFETGLSSGSPTAFPGGERDEWERTLFGGAYHNEGVPVSDRPKYGSLELVRFPDGPAPRFGSCYFVLRGAGPRTSITFMGSEHPHATNRVGTLEEPHAVMAALLAEIGKWWHRHSGLASVSCADAWRAGSYREPVLRPSQTPRRAPAEPLTRRTGTVYWTLGWRHKFTARSY